MKNRRIMRNWLLNLLVISLSASIVLGQGPTGEYPGAGVGFDSGCGYPNAGATNPGTTNPGLLTPCGTTTDVNTGPLFECKFIVKDIQDANPPSITFDIYEIVCINTLPNCNAPLNYISASFSMDPIDTKKTFHCSDIGDIQLTIFVWDVEDSNNDGTLEYIFREPCFAIQTVEDPSGFCTF